MKGPNLTWLNWRGVQVCPMVQQHGLRRGKLLETAFCTVRRLSADVELEVRWDSFCTILDCRIMLPFNVSSCDLVQRWKHKNKSSHILVLQRGLPVPTSPFQHCKFDSDSFRPPVSNLHVRTRPVLSVAKLLVKFYVETSDKLQNPASFATDIKSGMENDSMVAFGCLPDLSSHVLPVIQFPSFPLPSISWRNRIKSSAPGRHCGET